MGFNTRIKYTGDGVTSDYAIPFSYSNQSEVKLQKVVDGSDIPFTFLTGSTIRITTPANYQNVEFYLYRQTDITLPAVTWRAGGGVTADNLSRMQSQMFSAIQEALDKPTMAGPTGLPGDGTGDMLKANNLSELPNKVTARANLGLGSAALENVGTSGAVVARLSGTNIWSGVQTFTKVIIKDAPVTFNDSTAAANGRLWDVYAQGGVLTFRAVNDAYTSATGFMAVGRTGLVIDYVSFDGRVAMNYGGSITAGFYLNWGATAGSTGYGLRDNGGTIEFKNSGGSWLPIPSASQKFVTVRQTCVGPVDYNGYPNVLPPTSASLSLTTQGVTSTNPLTVSAAQGFGSVGALDSLSQFTANQTWSGLPANATIYLYVNAATGTLGFTTLPPVYQLGGTPSTVNGQFTFNISEMKGYLGNGTTASATPIVFVGEAVTNSTGVTNAVTYAYNGYYDGGWTNTLPASGTYVTKSHNIGVSDVLSQMLLKCLTAEFSYQVGDVVQPHGGYHWTYSLTHTTKTVGYIGSNVPVLSNRSTGAAVSLTLANWAYRFIVKRNW